MVNNVSYMCCVWGYGFPEVEIGHVGNGNPKPDEGRFSYFLFFFFFFFFFSFLLSLSSLSLLSRFVVAFAG
jgi:hypothetical protein